MKELILLNGKRINTALIRNPKLLRVFEDRRRQFMFNYGDSKKYGDHSDTGGHYREHTDGHRDSYGDYSERGTHTDCTKSSGEDKHIDYTDHTDKPHKDYSDYDDHSDSYYDVGPNYPDQDNFKGPK